MISSGCMTRTRQSTSRTGWTAISPLCACAMALTLVAAAAPAGLAIPAWHTDTIDNTPPNSPSVGIVTQGPGRMHVSYQDTSANEMMYATNAYGAAPWTLDGIDGPETGLGQNSAIAVAPDGSVHVSYYSQLMHDIKYATDASNVWEVQFLGLSTPDAHSAIAVDSGNHAHIASTNGTLQYSTNASGSLVTTVAKDASDNDIQADRVYSILVSADQVYVLHADAGNICLASNATGSWVQETIGASSSTDMPAAAALDASRALHVAWLDGTALKYATNASGAWVVSTADTLTQSAGFSVCIAAASASDVSIYYYNPEGGSIDIAGYDGSSWQVQSLYSVANVSCSAVALDSVGAVYMVYTDTTGNLKVVTDDAKGPHGVDLAITQTCDTGTVVAYEAVTFTVTVANRGPDSAAGVQAVVQIPAGANYDSATSSVGTVSHSATEVTWNIGALPAGQSEQMTLTVKMPAVTSGSAVLSVATVTSDPGSDPNDSNEFRTGNNTSSLTLQAVAKHQLNTIVAQDTGGEGHGMLSASNNQAQQDEGALVPVVATPDQGYHVKEWHGTIDDSSTANTNYVKMGTSDMTVTVTFAKNDVPSPQRTLATSVIGGHGTLAPAGGTYIDGTIVTLTAKPDPHYVVKQWTGTNNDNSTGKVNAVTMNANRTVTVEFEFTPNQPPHSVPDVDASVCAPGQTVTLDGSKSTDPEGMPLAYTWTQIGGPTVTLSDSMDVKPTFVAPQALWTQSVVFDLTVTDDMGLQDTAPVEVKVHGTCGQGVGGPTLLGFASLYMLGLVAVKRGRR